MVIFTYLQYIFITSVLSFFSMYANKIRKKLVSNGKFSKVMEGNIGLMGDKIGDRYRRS